MANRTPKNAAAGTDPATGPRAGGAPPGAQRPAVVAASVHAGGESGPGLWVTDTEPASVDTLKLRAGRLARLRAMMREKDYAAVLLLDPFNQRYATGSRNMFGYFLRNSTRYFFVPTEGPIVLFEYPQSYHVSMVLDTIDEARPSKLVWSSVSGRDDETAGPFADEITELLKKHGGGS